MKKSNSGISMEIDSQIFINTENPQGIFHVDGAKDDPSIDILWSNNAENISY